jgi:trans-aconitate methyltransferase
MFDRRSHWDKIYAERKPDEVSWHQERPALSLELIGCAAPSKKARVIDVGGGASRLAGALLDEGFSDVTVLDVSGRALACAKESLGGRAERVTWIESDVAGFAPEAAYELWHDRAVFHFLTEAAEREAYVDALRRSLKPGGAAVLAAFAPDGPETCSGLPVRRYDAKLLREAFGPGFELVHEAAETHVTPWKTAQKFKYFLIKRS